MREHDDHVRRPEQIVRVTTLELFFDLVFVFTMTQLTAVLAEDVSAGGLLRVVLMLGVIFWMYGAYAWLTNAVAPERVTRRLVLLGGMAGYLVLALAIPVAFTGGGAAFGLAYLVIVVIHVGLFARASSTRTVRAILRIAPFNIASALLVLGGGILGGTAQYVLWSLAFLLEWVTPSLAGLGGFDIGAAHFVERHGLVVIVALGESIVAIGIGAAGLPVDAALAGAAVLGLLLSACLWWVYFGGDDVRAEHALVAAPPERRPRLALVAFGYWHLPILLGVVALAAGMKQVVGHAFERLDPGSALALAGGVTLFLCGDALFRRTLAIGRAGPRTAAAALALATVPLGVAVSSLAQLAALVALLACLFAVERRGSGPAAVRAAAGSGRRG
jgi:low temperature requirement protein LtrA